MLGWRGGIIASRPGGHNRASAARQRRLIGLVYRARYTGRTHSERGKMSSVLPPAAQAVLRAYRDLLGDAAPGLVTGLYLYGSLALDAFSPQLSDIDFVAVTSRRCAPGDLAALEKVHSALLGRFPRPFMEGNYVIAEDMGRLREALPPLPHVVEGVLHPSGYRDISLVNWWVLRERGVVVWGLPVADYGYTIGWGELLAAMYENLNSYWAGGTVSPRALAWLLTDEGVEWSVLGVLRLFYTFRERDIASKAGAGQYGLEHLPARWHGLIRYALRRRLGQPPAPYRSRIARALETRAFVRSVIATCNAERAA